jgi:hypothetical protein
MGGASLYQHQGVDAGLRPLRRPLAGGEGSTSNGGTREEDDEAALAWEYKWFIRGDAP